MKNVKTVLAMLLAVVMIAAIFAGCGGNGGKDQNTTGPAVTTVQGSNEDASGSETADRVPAEKMKISVALWDMNLDYQNEQDVIYQKVQEKLNIELDPVVITWDDYHDKINVWAASGQLPDVFNIDAFGTRNFYGWVEGGIIKPLPSDLSAYPNAAKIFELPDVQSMKVDGKYWAFPRMNLSKPDPFGWARSRVCYIRKDWMQKLNLAEPTTFDEFYNVLKAIQNGNPEGDGRKITGLVTYDLNFLDFVMLAFMPVEYNQWIKDEADGKYKPAFFTADQLDALNALRKLYADGILDKDYAIQKVDEGLAKFSDGKAAAACYQLTGPYDFNVTFGEKFEKNFPEKKAVDSFGLLKNLKNEKYGKTFVFNLTSWWSEAYINGTVDDKKADRIMQTLDYFCSEEFLSYANWGIEGVDYKKEGDKYTITREKDEKGNFVPLSSKYKFLSGWPALGTWGLGYMGFDDPTVDPKLAEMGKELWSWYPQNCTVPEQNFRAGFISTPLKDSFKMDLMADLNKIIIGKEPVEVMYKKIVDNYKAKGLDKMLEEVNQALAAEK